MFSCIVSSDLTFQNGFSGSMHERLFLGQPFCISDLSVAKNGSLIVALVNTSLKMGLGNVPVVMACICSQSKDM